MKFRFNLLYVVFALGLLLFIPMTRQMLRFPEEFYGIAETQVRAINVEYSVEIQEIAVVLGQRVEEGQLLAKLYRTDLPIKINNIQYEIQDLQLKKLLETQQLKSEIEQVKAKKATTAADFDQEIKALETESAVQSDILKSVKSLPGKDASNSYAQQKLEALKQQKDLELKEIDLQNQRLQKDLSSAQSPLDLRIQKLQNELELLKKQEAELSIYAPQAGIIGQLDFQPGEKLSPYTNILKIYDTRPNVVTTYIADGRLASIEIGDTLAVQSINQPEYRVAGVVAGLGTRVTLLPERLRKDPDLRAWGREVQLQIPADNSFLQGEKVLVTSRSPQPIRRLLMNSFSPN